MQKLLIYIKFKILLAHWIMEEFTKMLRTRQCDLKRAITVYKTQFKSNSKSYNPETEIAKDIRFKFVAKKPLSELRNIFNGKQESQYIKVGLDIYIWCLILY